MGNGQSRLGNWSDEMPKDGVEVQWDIHKRHLGMMKVPEFLKYVNVSKMIKKLFIFTLDRILNKRMFFTNK
jgi:hypothetical protein